MWYMTLNQPNYIGLMLTSRLFAQTSYPHPKCTPKSCLETSAHITLLLIHQILRNHKPQHAFLSVRVGRWGEMNKMA